MNPDRAERQKKFLAIAAEHAEDFKARVAQHDRENSFPHENVAAMKASGYTNMTAPAELGGGGADILDEVLAQERLARGDLPTAISINMHLFAVGWLSDLWHAGGKREGGIRSFLESIVRDRLILGGGVSRKSSQFVPLLSIRPPVVPADLLNDAGNLLDTALRRICAR